MQGIPECTEETRTDAGFIPCQSCLLLKVLRLLLQAWLRKKLTPRGLSLPEEEELLTLCDSLMETDLPRLAEFPHELMLVLLEGEWRRKRWCDRFGRKPGAVKLVSEGESNG
jgi:hypothetical protein